MSGSDDLLIMTKIDTANYKALKEAIPHVGAWCYLADGVILPDGVPFPECPQSCDDHRANAAGSLYAAGFRKPPEVKDLLKKIDPPPVPTVVPLGQNLVIGSNHPAGKARKPVPKQAGSGVKPPETS